MVPTLNGCGSYIRRKKKWILQATMAVSKHALKTITNFFSWKMLALFLQLIKAAVSMDVDSTPHAHTQKKEKRKKEKMVCMAVYEHAFKVIHKCFWSRLQSGQECEIPAHLQYIVSRQSPSCYFNCPFAQICQFFNCLLLFCILPSLVT